TPRAPSTKSLPRSTPPGANRAPSWQFCVPTRRRGGGITRRRVLLSPRPELAVQAAVADGLGDVAVLNVGAPVEVGDGPRHAQDAVVRPRRQAQLLHRLSQQALARLVQRAVPAQLPATHLRVEAVAVRPE